jgi:hypothetical protein
MKVPCHHLPGGTEKNHGKPVRLASAKAKIFLNGHLTNTGIEHCCCTSLLSLVVLNMCLSQSFIKIDDDYYYP